MTTIRSSIPAVITAVLSTITTALAGQNDPYGSPVRVYDGEVGEDVEPEYVQVQGVTNGSQTWGAIGKQRRNETYEIHGMIRVYTGNDDQAYTRQRCFDLFALIETAFDNDPQVGAVVNGAVQASALDLRMGVTDLGGRASELDFALAVTTQLIAV